MLSQLVQLGPLAVSSTERIATVGPADWDALAGDDNPFVEHAFLDLLERAQCVGGETSWQPRHLLVHEGGRLVGAAPTYLRYDSYGEYIFDWGWAEAAQRAGIPYYPKLLVAIPFTPATGPRLLSHPAADRGAVRRALIAGLAALEQRERASGTHVLFPLDEEAALLADAGFLRRSTHQFHWRNDGYADYEAFLAALRSSGRKNLRKERRRVTEQGVTIEQRNGATLSPDEWATVYRAYRSTTDRKWGDPYLNAAFFEGLSGPAGARALVCFARRGTEIVAATLSFAKGAHVYGRYWGCFDFVDGLHFELCYHQLIDFAIAGQKLLVEAGAQGEHKIKRGFVPVITHSAHRLRHEGLREGVARALALERARLQGALAGIAEELPFRPEALPKFPPVAGIDLRRPA